LYKVSLSIDGQNFPVYATLDGKYLVSGVVPLSGNAGVDATGTNAPSTPIDVSTDDDAVLGDINAPVTIIEFSDYQCPFCAKFWSETLPLLKKDYIDTGKVKLVYRDYPLDFHPVAQSAAEAAECIRGAAKSDAAYFEMHDKIFANQLSLSIDNLKKWAKELGYDIGGCLDSKKFENEVQADLQVGASYGVSGTPAFFIDGILIEGAQPYSAFKKIIDAQLAKKQ